MTTTPYFSQASLWRPQGPAITLAPSLEGQPPPPSVELCKWASHHPPRRPRQSRTRCCSRSSAWTTHRLRREFDTHADLAADDKGERRMSKAGLASFMHGQGLCDGQGSCD